MCLLSAAALLMIPQCRNETAGTIIQTEFGKYPGNVVYNESGTFHFPDGLPQRPVEFSYDTDGDGREETYYFGVLQDVFDEPQYSMWDSVGRPYDENDRIYRTAAAAVFEKTADGRYVPVDGFSGIMQDPDITLYYIDLKFGEDVAMPVLTAESPLYDIWQGAERIEYSIGCIGAWVVEASAGIGGERYTAFTLTEIRTDWNGIPLP